IEILNQVAWLGITVPLLTGVISSVVQIFYAWRIWVLSQQPYIPVFVVLVALVQCAGAAWSGIHATSLKLFSEVTLKNGTPTILWLGGTALCDVIVAISMIYYLARSRTGFRSTNIILVKLIRITVETGFIVATVAVIDLTLFLTFNSTNYHIAPASALSKLYSNSLLVVRD
ncbi:hypothetical protein M422DRAFT_169008, partial [Sphaerobolus stellatus SS14]